MPRKRTAARRRSGTGGRAARLAPYGLAALLLVTHPVAAPEPIAQQRLGPQSAAVIAAEVLADPPFRVKRTERALAWRHGFDPWEASSGKPPGDLEWLLRGLSILAELIRFGLWVGLAAFVVWAALRAREWYARTTGRMRPPPREVVEVRSEEGLRPQLPDEPAAVAERLLAAGQPRAALALLYRAMLASLAQTAGPFGSGATEADAIEGARRALGGARLRYVERLIAAWTEAAYAHRIPGDVAELCRDWRLVLGLETEAT